MHQLHPKTRKTPPSQGGEAHSYRLLVAFGASVTGDAGQQIHKQTGHLTFEKPRQTQQHRSQEQVLLLGLAVAPEPEHGQGGADGLGRRLAPREELSYGGEEEAQRRVFIAYRRGSDRYHYSHLRSRRGHSATVSTVLASDPVLNSDSSTCLQGSGLTKAG